MEGYLTLRWVDKRIQYVNGDHEASLLDFKSAFKSFWIPDLWIKSLRGYVLHKNYKEQATIEINNKNEIRFWQR